MAFCNQCGTELPAGAKFCAHCGAAVAGTDPAATADRPAGAPPVQPAAASFRQPAPTDARASGGGPGWVLPVLVGIAVLAIAYLMFAPARTGPSAEREKAGDTVAAGRAGDEAPRAAATAGASARAATGPVSAAVLDSAFFSDPDDAAARYAGPVRVAGTIATMVQPGPTPALSMEGRTRFNYMVVNFPAGYRERLAPLSKGQVITVTCDEVRGLGGTTILSGCLLD